MQDGDSITGKYEFESQGWIGELTGKLVGARVVFRWRWIEGQMRGLGYWDVGGNGLVLVGRWYHHEETADFTLQQLANQPTLLDGVDIDMVTNRTWRLKRTMKFA